MNKVVSTLLILLVILLFIVLFINHKRQKYDITITNKTLKTINVFQFNSSFSNLTITDKPTSPFIDILNDYKNKFVIVNEFDKANLIFFTDYSLIDQNLGNVPFINDTKYYIYGLKGSDEMANKANLAHYMKLAQKDIYIPKSFILDKSEDINILKDQHTDKSLYIIKKNVQRQEGTLITNDINFIINKASDENYVVCQELLQNPYLINGRKINIRIYLLIIIDENSIINFYIYKNGFMYYTPQLFKTNSLEKDTNITTGYIDRQIYIDNPLTIYDLFTFIGKDKTELLTKNMITMFKAFKDVYKNVLIENNKNIPGIKFNIYGVDVAPDENLNTTIIELNKGPDINSDGKGNRDREVKLGMIYDCFNLTGLIDKGNKNNFIKL